LKKHIRLNTTSRQGEEAGKGELEMERVAITLPKNLQKAVEKKRKEIGLNRSEIFRKALVSLLGLERTNEEKAIEKYGPIYEKLNKESLKISKKMMSIARKTLPGD